MSATYKDLLKEFSLTEPKYAVYYLDAKDNNGKAKVVYFFWAPFKAPVKVKMLWTSSNDAMKAGCAGFDFEIQAQELDEVSFEALLEKANRPK